MFKEVKGDLFDFAGKPGAAIGHGVNCKGVMGAGIAKPFREKFPAMYFEYKRLCRNESLMPGGFHFWRENGVQGYNLASQDAPGATARYTYVVWSVSNALDHAKTVGITSLYIPRIGCGIGGLQYKNVKFYLSSLGSKPVNLIVVSQ